MSARPREEVAQEYAHVTYVLNDMGRWSESDVSVAARQYLRHRYQGIARVLKTVLDTPAGEVPEVPTWQPPKRVAPPTPLMPAAAAAPAAERSEEEAEAAPSARRRPTPPPAADPASRSGGEAARAPAPPVAPLLPDFAVPHEPDADEQVIEEASKWNELWKPFLYERIGWFIGAFLILAGSFYFVAVSWSGMSAVVQTLVVFSLTAGYSAAFSLGGAWLGRRAGFESAGRVLMLIGSAVAPLANLAFQSAEGVQRWVGVPVGVLWAVASAALFGLAARAIDERTHRPMQLSMLVSAAAMATAPLLASFGSPMLWLNALPLVLLQRLWRHRAERDANAVWFVVCAPLYLVALFSLRLHLALDQAGALPQLATYAPFIALLLSGALGLRKLQEERAADVLSVAVVAGQVLLVVASGFGEAPALFATCGLLGWTTWQLSRGGAASRARWLYGTYVAAQLAYQTCGQLVPGVLRKLVVAVKEALGYAATAPLPFNFDAVYALPAVIAGAALAVRLERRGEKHVAEVLLRATAGAAALFTAVAFAGNDLRAALWSVPLYAVLCLGLGQWLQRSYLVIVGAIALLAVPWFGVALFGSPAAGVLTGATAVALALFSIVQTRQTRVAVSAVAGALAAAAVGLGWLGAPPQLGGVLAVALGGGAGLLVARNLDARALISVAVSVLVSAVPLALLAFHPEAAPLSLAVTSLALAALAARSDRGRALSPAVVVSGLVAAAWCWALQADRAAPASLLGVTLLGPTLLLSALAQLELGRRDRLARPLGAALLALAAFPTVPGVFEAFPFSTPVVSASVLAGLSLAASVIAARRGRGPASMTLAAVAQAGCFLAWIVSAEGSLAGGAPAAAIASVAALLSARALHPWFSVPWAAALALVWLAPPGLTWAMIAVAVALTAIALLPEWRRAHALLLGGAKVSTAASLSAAVVLLFCAVKHAPPPGLLQLSVYGALPLLWVRATRRGFFALLLAPLAALFISLSGGAHEWLWFPPIAVALTTRLVAELPAARRLLVDGDERLAARFQRWALAGLAAVGLSVLLWVLWDSRVEAEGRLLWLYAGAFAFAGGGPLWMRLLASTALLALMPAVRPLLAPALVGVAFAAHHLPVQTHRLLGAPSDARSPLWLSGIALAASLVPWLYGWPTNGDLLLTAGVVLALALLHGQSWMVTIALVLGATTSLGFMPLGASWLVGGVKLGGMAAVALLAAAGSALLLDDDRSERVRTRSGLLGRGFEGDLHLPLWIAGLLSAGAALALQLGEVGSRAMPPAVAVALAVAAGLLFVTRDRIQAVFAVVVLGGVLVVSAPMAALPWVIAAYGAGLCWLGAWLEGEREIADALHHAGWVVSLVAIAFCRSLHQLSTPLCFALIAAAGWAVVWRRREREPAGWLASLAAVHVLLFHLGVVLSTGKPQSYIFPYIAAASSIATALALSLAGERFRRGLGVGFAALALLELLGGIVSIPLAAGEVARPEAWVGALGMLVLVVALIRAALQRSDEALAYLAQGAILLGYLALRLHGGAAHELGSADAVAALLAGAFFSGLHGWAARRDEVGVLAGPAWVGAVGLPLLGLLVAPWDQPLVTAALLVGHAAHFAAAARLGEHRRTASLLAAAAFNAALFFVWLGSGFGQPQYYVIPGALSLLLLVRVFADDLSTMAQARMRAVAITVIYLGAAWPLVFAHSWQMLLCAFVCVVGVAVGVALRIRSYVYLGTGFLVSSVVANLIRFGVRDPRLGALFLSLLGLLIVGFMIFLTAQRAQLLRRYDRVRMMLSTWEA